MRLGQTSYGREAGSGAALEQYLGNLSVALVRAKAEKDIRDARAAAEAAIRVRSSFLENMNHELRTPLNAIIGFAGMLQQADKYSLSVEQKETYAEYIIQSADLLLGHINTILETAALDNGSVVPIHEPVDVYEMLDRALGAIEVQASAKRVSILCAHQIEAKKTSKPLQKLAPVWADDERIGQAVDHLLKTSVKSCNKGGKILIRTLVTDQDTIEIQLRDDGHGFSEEEIEEALTAFGNIHRGLGRPFAGPGVGISIAKTFIEMQGGAFAIRSRRNKGTLITISLPIATPDQIAAHMHTSHGLQGLVEEECADVCGNQDFAKSA